MKLDTPEGPARMTRNPDGSSTINMGVKGTFTQKLDGQTLHMKASNLTMEGFADMLTPCCSGQGSGRQVVDMTGLKGNYQVAVDLSLADLIANARAQGMDIPTPPRSERPADTSASAERLRTQWRLTGLRLG